LGEKRVVFHEEDQQLDYSDGEPENDKRPVSKLHRRDTPHHLKNKRVQQHLNDKAANVILTKLKEMPHPVIDEVSPQVEINPMPLVQDVGLPVIDHFIETSNQNGIHSSSAHENGKFAFHIFVFDSFTESSTIGYITVFLQIHYSMRHILRDFFKLSSYA
jgi:hypothetical protein